MVSATDGPKTIQELLEPYTRGIIHAFFCTCREYRQRSADTPGTDMDERMEGSLRCGAI